MGCGGDSLPPWLSGEETRLDIDPKHSPDIVADMRDMGDIGPFDALYCSHALEHLYPHEVQPALEGFRRALKPGGHALIIVPDLEDVRPTEEPLFNSPAGPITGLDLYYGKRSMIETSAHMAHHTGFVSKTLHSAFMGAGFSHAEIRRLPYFNLFGVAIR